MPVPILTPAAIDRLRRGRLFDDRVPGLCIEMLASGKKRWLYRRRLKGSDQIVRRSIGLFPTVTIAGARAWASQLNQQLEAGIDPREHLEAHQARQVMTVAQAHALYMIAVREGRASRAKRPSKPRTIAYKREMFTRIIAPMLSDKAIHDVTEDDLANLVEAKGRTAKVRANRLAAELRVFFGWASSLGGREVGLAANPAHRLREIRYPETKRARTLSLEEISWLLRALAEERPPVRKGMLLWLLTAARLNEVVQAPTCEVRDGTWIIPARRTKTSRTHVIPLGPWARSLINLDDDWIIPAARSHGPRDTGWHGALKRVKQRMEGMAGHPIDRFTPHDFRRTVRSNTLRLGVSTETAEAMLNHAKPDLAQTYEQYEYENEKRDGFERWEREIARFALEAGMADALEVPGEILPHSPQRARVEPCYDLRPPETGASAIFGGANAKLVFVGEMGRRLLAQPVYLPAGQAGDFCEHVGRDHAVSGGFVFQRSLRASG